jgi:hypothetical protein
MVAVAIVAGGYFLYGLFFSRRIIKKRGSDKYFLSMVLCLVLVAGLAFVASWRLSPNEKPYLVIAGDYVSCRSWGSGQSLQVPWGQITAIAPPENDLRYFWTLRIRFDIHPRFRERLGDWVQAHGWVLCQVDGLTDDVWRPWLTTDTSMIHERLLAAWAKGRTR